MDSNGKNTEQKKVCEKCQKEKRGDEKIEGETHPCRLIDRLRKVPSRKNPRHEG